MTFKAKNKQAAPEFTVYQNSADSSFTIQVGSTVARLDLQDALRLAGYIYKQNEPPKE